MQRSTFRILLAVLAVAVLVTVDGVWAQQDTTIKKVTEALPDKAPAQPKQPRKLLIFSRTKGFRHGSIAIGSKAIAMMGDKTGAYTALHTEDQSFFEPEKLKVFDAVFMLNTTGDCLRFDDKFVDAKGEVIFGAKEGKLDQKTIVVDAKGKEIAGGKVGKVDGKDAPVGADGKPIANAKLAKTGGRTAIVDAKGQELPTAKKIPADPELEARLKKSLADFVSSGKGLAGCHSATDTYHGWKEYNQMIGGTFAGHPWSTKVPVKNLDPKHPVNAVFDGKDFEVSDEIYQFRADTALPTDRRFLLALDTKAFDVSKGSRKDGLYPVSWVGTFGKGRTFYCSLGHGDHIYWNPTVLRHYLAGIQYALGDLQCDATPSVKSEGK